MRTAGRWLALIAGLCLAAANLNGCSPQTDSLIDGAVYQIVSEDSRRTLGARSFGMNDGDFTELQSYDGDLNQLWRLHKREDGTYRLENLAAGRYLTLKQGRTEENTAACVSPAEDSTAYNWLITPKGDSSFTVSSALSDLYLQADEEGRATGTIIVQKKKSNKTAQRWTFVQVDNGSRALPVMLQLSGSLEHSSTPEIQHFGDTYYLYAMQDGVSVKTSPDMLSWTKQANILSTTRGYPYSWMADVVSATQVGSIWAPGVYKIGEKYGLYYCFSVEGKQTSAIGLVTNTTLDPADPDYRWVSQGPVIISKNGDDFNAIDPNVITDESGQPWLAYGSYWTGIKLRRLDAATGLLLDDEVFSIASRVNTDKAIEAPYIVRRDGYYYLFCAVEPMSKNYHVECGRSRNITGPYLDRNGTDMMEGGGTAVTEGKAGVQIPGHASVFQDTDGSWYLVTEYFRDGSNSLLGISTLLWDEEGWPITALSPELFSKN